MATKPMTATEIMKMIATTPPAAIASLGMPNEPLSDRHSKTRMPNTATARMLMQQTFEMELQIINAQRQAQGIQPILNINALNAHLRTPFFESLTAAIHEASRGIAFSAVPQAIPATPHIEIGSRVRIQDNLDHRDLGVPIDIMGISGEVTDYDQEEEADGGHGWEVRFEFWGAYWFTADQLEIIQ